MIKNRIKHIGVPVMILMTGILFSCVNDLETIQRVTYDPNAPEETSRELYVLYTDSGYPKLEINSKIAETYLKPKHIVKFRKGLKVLFYSGKGEVTSRLTAKYGEIDHETGIVTVRDSVIFENFKTKQTLETEELFWNQNDTLIYTDKNVVIKSEGEGVTGMGKGLKTDHSFTRYEIKEPTGSIKIKKEEK